MSGTITFIGKVKADENEKTALDFLGRIIGTQEHNLILTPKGDSNRAVREGYSSKFVLGLHEVTKPGGIFEQETDQVLVYADKPLLAALDRAHPQWRDLKPAVIEGHEELYIFIDLALAKHQERTGEVIEPFDRPTG